MKTEQQIKQHIKTTLENCGVFDSVYTPSDDRRDSTIMREPAASISMESSKTIEDQGVQLTEYSFAIYMKFLTIGVNDLSDDIQLVIDSLTQLEPTNINRELTSGDNKRSSLYKLKIDFVGCKS
ncbi:MAG: hypothetical protein C0603_05655 [Denitrovibrio sp.]|nr:MAG: hypothetical protein C0603_05655 [Denitrovibrio sp.]